ncbi:hypothetical protein GEMRC1_010673 [Eukaryota sp. GEM-RC1]
MSQPIDGPLSSLKIYLSIEDEERNEELEDVIVAMGGKIRGLSQRTNIVVFEQGSSSDLEKAHDLNVPVVTPKWVLKCQSTKSNITSLAPFLVKTSQAPSHAEADSPPPSNIYATQEDLISHNEDPQCPPAPKKPVPTSAEQRRELAREALPVSQQVDFTPEVSKPKDKDFEKDLSLTPDDAIQATLNLFTEPTIAEPVPQKVKDPFDFEEDDIMETSKSPPKERTPKEKNPKSLVTPVKKYKKKSGFQNPLKKTPKAHIEPDEVEVTTKDSVKTTRTRLKKSTETTATVPAKRTPKTTRGSTKKAKKPKVTDNDVNVSDVEEITICDDTDSSGDESQLTTVCGGLKVGFSRLSESMQTKLVKLKKTVGSSELSIVDTSDPSEVEGVDVLVYGEDIRTPKVLFGIVGGSVVVKPDWITDCIKSKKLLDATPFESEAFPGFKAARLFFEAVAHQKEQGGTAPPYLLEGLSIAIAKNTLLDHHQLARLVKALKPEKIYSLTRTLSSDRVDYSIVPKNADKVPPHARGKVVRENWLYDSIAQFTLLPVDDYLLGTINDFTVENSEAEDMEA